MAEVPQGAGAPRVESRPPWQTREHDRGTALAAKNGSCTFAVALRPTSAGAKAITLRAASSNGVVVERTFTGTGIVY
jgi:hypothetical protein